MVGRRLVGGCGQHKSTGTTRQIFEPTTISISCKSHTGDQEASKPSSVSCPGMSSCDGIRGELVEGKKKPDTEPVDRDRSSDGIEPISEQQLGEKLQRLSTSQSKGEAQKQVLEGSFAQAERLSDHKCFSEESNSLPAKDARILEQRTFPKTSAKKRFFDRAKETRPMSLATLNQVSDEEFCRSHPGSVDPRFSRHGSLHITDDHSLPNGYCLPSSLASSPHSVERRNLDPNAREFTPCVSCSESFGYHPHQPVPLAPLGHSFSVSPEMAQFAYNADVCGAGFPIQPYANGGPVYFGAFPNAWDRSSVGFGVPAGVNLPGCRPNAPPIIVGPQPAHVGLLPLALSQPPTPGHFRCYPGIESPIVPAPSHALSVHSSPTGKEHASRSLLLTGVAACTSEEQLRKDLECWGPVRALELDRLQEGIVIVHYFDLRHARNSLKDIQNQHLQKQQNYQQHLQCHNNTPDQIGCRYSSDFPSDGKKCSEAEYCDIEYHGKKGLIGGIVVWAQYTSSLAAAVPDAYNLGTLVVFNVDADVSIDDLRAVFQKYGDVKELRETPSKRQHKFVEFYDVRDAAAAWSALNGHEICGKAVKIEFSRPGGQARRAKGHTDMSGVAMHLGACAVAANVRIHNQTASSFHPCGWTAETFTGSQNLAGNPVGLPTQFMWSNYPVAPGTNAVHHQWQRFPEGHPQPTSYPANVCATQNANGLLVTGTPGSLLSKNNGANHEFLPGSGSPTCNGHASGGRLPLNGPRNGEAPAARRRRNGLCNGGTHLKMDDSNLIHTDGDGRLASETGVVARESTLSGRTGLTPREAHAQYMFDEREAHLNLPTPRTTLMIRNIPNKYSQQMLLSLLDQHCLRCNSQILDSEPQSAYDFVYLPIDFKNRCNLGYAFVNFTTALATLKFYKAFHEQAWEAFNSRKICHIAYARVQGRAALEEHFRNSRFACDTDEYLPLVFSPARSGIECPPPRVAAGQLHGKAHGRVDSCRSPSRNGYFQDQGAPGCSPRSEKGSFDGTGLGISTLTNVAVEGVGA